MKKSFVAIIAVACLLVGGLGGYLLSVDRSSPAQKALAAIISDAPNCYVATLVQPVSGPEEGQAFVEQIVSSATTAKSLASKVIQMADPANPGQTVWVVFVTGEFCSS